MSYRKRLLALSLTFVTIVVTAIVFVLPRTYPLPEGPAVAPVDQHETVLPKLSFRLKWVAYSGFGPQCVAYERGLYSEAGVDVQVQPGGPGIDPIRLVATGADEIGLASYDQIIIARAKGLPLVAICEDTTKSGVGFTALRDSGISSPQDFVGKKVGVLPGTDKDVIYQALLAKLMIDRKAIQEIPVGSNMDVLFNKTVDVYPSFITNQPIVAEEKGFRVNVIDPYEYGIKPGGNVVFTSESTLKTRRKDLKRFLIGELRGIRMSQGMQDADVVEAVIKHNPKLNRDTEVKIWQATRDMLYRKDPKDLGVMGRETWEYTARLLQSFGVIEAAPDVGSCYTNDIVDEIQSEGLIDVSPADESRKRVRVPAASEK